MATPNSSVVRRCSNMNCSSESRGVWVVLVVGACGCLDWAGGVLWNVISVCETKGVSK